MVAIFGIYIWLVILLIFLVKFVILIVVKTLFFACVLSVEFDENIVEIWRKCIKTMNIGRG